MTEFAFSTTDVAVIGILLVSGLLAFFRGLVHELLAIGKWIGALLAAFYGFDILLPLVSNVVANDLAAQITTSIVLFVTTLVILAYISHEICDHVHESSLGTVDRGLGFLFGLFRGAVIVCLVFMLLTWLNGGTKDMPLGMAKAKTFPMMKDGSAMLARLLGVDDIFIKESKSKEAPAKKVTKPTSAKPTKKEEAKPANKGETKPPAKAVEKESSKKQNYNLPSDAKKGYSDQTRESLDELIEQTQ